MQLRDGDNVLVRDRRVHHPVENPPERLKILQKPGGALLVLVQRSVPSKH